MASLIGKMTNYNNQSKLLDIIKIEVFSLDLKEVTITEDVSSGGHKQVSQERDLFVHSVQCMTQCMMCPENHSQITNRFANLCLGT